MLCMSGRIVSGFICGMHEINWQRDMMCMPTRHCTSKKINLYVKVGGILDWKAKVV